MYRASDVVFDTDNDTVYVVEQFNHRISKWIYEPSFFVFSLADGNVTSVTLADGGTNNYTTALLVIEGPTGTAKADATVATGEVTSIVITNGGSGYTTAPAVTITSVEGSSATATATITDGIVTNITITAGGSGYLTGTQILPLVVIDAPEGKSRATATAVANGTIITSVTLTSNGNGYDEAAPDVSIVSDTTNTGDASVTSIANTTAWGNNGDGTTGEGAPVTSTTDNALYRPTGIVYDDTKDLLYVTDTFHNRIRVIDPANGAFLSSTGQGGFGDGDFYRPAGIAIGNSDGTIVIADELNSRAVNYATVANPGPPTFVQELPAPTLSFIRPHGVIYDVSDNLFNVTDSLRGLISNYNTAATTFNAQFGTPGTAPANVNLFYPGSGKGILTGTGGPDTIFADTRNNALKSVDNLTVDLTTGDGSTAGTGNGELYWPESVAAAVDTAQYVLAANTYNNRIEIFSSAVAVLTSESPFNFGSPGSP